MPGLRDLKRRIKSIGSTRKITRALQMVSAAKMRKAQNAVTSSRTYSQLAWELITNISGDEHMRTALDLPLLKIYPQAEKVGVVVLTSNRGMVGSLNSNLLPMVREVVLNSAARPFMGSKESDKLVPDRDRGSANIKIPSGNELIAEIITYGKKAQQIIRRLGAPVAADFQKMEKSLAAKDIYPLITYLTDLYAGGKYRKIVLVYNHFVSTLVQKPTIKQLLPIVPEIPAAQKSPAERERVERLNPESEYLFEPTPKQVLEHLLPRIIESQIYQAILESDASEHSARMVMMKNATEAAGDLISDLTLTYNQLRQNKITTELAEITAGRIALE